MFVLIGLHVDMFEQCNYVYIYLKYCEMKLSILVNLTESNFAITEALNTWDM